MEQIVKTEDGRVEIQEMATVRNGVYSQERIDKERAQFEAELVRLNDKDFIATQVAEAIVNNQAKTTRLDVIQGEMDS